MVSTEPLRQLFPELNVLSKFARPINTYADSPFGSRYKLTMEIFCLPIDELDDLIFRRYENPVIFRHSFISSLTLNLQKKSYILAEDIKNALYDCVSIDKYSH
jgi:hypothetical protein